MNWPDHSLIVIMGIIFPVVAMRSAGSGQLQKMHFDTANKKMLYYSNGLMLWGMALVVVINWWWQGRSFGQLGLQWGQLPFSSKAWWIVGAFVVLYGLDVFAEIGTAARRAKTLQHFQQKVGFLPSTATEYGHFAFLALTAGVCEEIVFRGYFITYFKNVFAALEAPYAIWLALILPAISFSLAHLYQGWKAVVKIVAMALLFGAFFLETKMLWPLILIHVVVDLLGGLINWSIQLEQER